MPLSLRQMFPDDKIVQQTLLHVFEHLYPVSLLSQILEQTHAWEQRERETNMVQMCSLIMALHLFPRLSQGGVLRELAAGLRWIWPVRGLTPQLVYQELYGLLLTHFALRSLYWITLIIANLQGCSANCPVLGEQFRNCSS